METFGNVLLILGALSWLWQMVLVYWGGKLLANGAKKVDIAGTPALFGTALIITGYLVK